MKPILINVPTEIAIAVVVKRRNETRNKEFP